jgi:hypothetical protein
VRVHKQEEGKKKRGLRKTENGEQHTQTEIRIKDIEKGVEIGVEEARQASQQKFRHNKQKYSLSSHDVLPNTLYV